MVTVAPCSPFSVSAGLLTWPVFFKVSAEQMLWIRVIDSTVCAIFAAEFFLHWRQAGWGWAFAVTGLVSLLALPLWLAARETRQKEPVAVTADNLLGLLRGALDGTEP